MVSGMNQSPSPGDSQAGSVTRPTLILRDRRERKERCTIWPLRHHPGIKVVHHPWKSPPDLQGYILLWHDGPPLGPDDADKGLLLIDGSWRWAGKLALPFESLARRSIQGIQTSYPRKSKLFEDPQEGLATVEALYAAHFFMGKDTSGLLDHYLWRDLFLERNPILGGKPPV